MDVPEWARQRPAAVRMEWGAAGVLATAEGSVVIVDVLRFTTAVEAATTAGASVYPYRWRDESAVSFAASVEAVLADERDPLGPSLSPVRLRDSKAGDRIVLPSPNGSTCAAIAEECGATVVAACLRNYRAVGEWLRGRGGPVAVVACGERWPDGSLRPALEDYAAAGLLISTLEGVRSAEAELAAALVAARSDGISELVRECVSGRELLERGWAEDLDYAVQLDVSRTVPVLTDGAFVDVTAR